MQRIDARGHAQTTADGVVFDVAAFGRERYGKLHVTGEASTSWNFALWKNSRSDEVGFESPLGYGRPGW
jgi:cysteinyl-tRNA synthetase